LSSRAVQNGADKDGIWGFLLKDIKAELTRGSREVFNISFISFYSTVCNKIINMILGMLLLQKKRCYNFML